MAQYDCPQCGAPVVFQSATAEAAVCGFCQSMVVRKDVNVEVIGKMAVLPPDMSPLQIGSHGAIEGLGFTLLGRQRVKWEDGSWNEWFIEYGDHTRGWVGEAQGFFMVLRETALKEGLSVSAGDLKAGGYVAVNGHNYRVTDAKPVTCLGGEGELPEAVSVGEQWVSVDLERGDGFVATLEQSGQGWRFFEGKNASFVELGWQNLRAIPGWNGVPLQTERNKTNALNCPSCGGVINLRAAGFTMTATCSHCGKLLDTSSPQLTVVQAAAKARTLKPAIPLGQRGTLDGIEWECIGFQQRRDPWAAWIEYLVFNPCQGFRWLTEFQGHWTWIDRLLSPPDSGPDVSYQGRSYRLYANEKCQVTYVEGEFYWQVRKGEKATVGDYISPPFILSRETYEDLNEVSWSIGEYIEADKLKAAFKLPSIIKDDRGTVGIVQPNPYGERWRSLKSVMIALLAALFVVQVFTSLGHHQSESLRDSFTFDRTLANAATATPLVSKPFEIKQQGGVIIESDAAVDNAWMGYEFELVNQQTGVRYPGEVSVEYYHGYDDGNWTEGSQHATATVPGVPPGTYTLALSPDADPAITRLPFTVNVKSGATYWSNFFLGLLCMLAYPLYVGIRYHLFEAKRWSSSDNSPYPEVSSSDDD